MQNQLHNCHFVNVDSAVVSVGRSATRCLCAEQGYEASGVLFLALCHFCLLLRS